MDRSLVRLTIGTSLAAYGISLAAVFWRRR